MKSTTSRKHKITGGKATKATKKMMTKKKPSQKKKINAWDSDARSDSESDGSIFDIDASGDEKIIMTEDTDMSKQSIEQIYLKKTQLEHILLRPDTYVGSIEHVEQNIWISDDEKKKMVMKKIMYVPKHQVYVPELIFGHLLTGSDFDDNKKKETTGGRNGYGAKLANIFSNEFIVETADLSTKHRYRQVFESNMGRRNPPSITKWTQKAFPAEKSLPTPRSGS
ncbi:unnamed protein product [Peronospora belbahrii]|uniref:DNA topoisomerase (ATP-hydrolyzing) n=1 Tax=Peronospora belbahrii TaxID=622444 RepID=A0ABN8D3L0_9STRA|nr:unnamed protein product [Peronospora belbahrii]